MFDIALYIVIALVVLGGGIYFVRKPAAGELPAAPQPEPLPEPRPEPEPEPESKSERDPKPEPQAPASPRFAAPSPSKSPAAGGPASQASPRVDAPAETVALPVEKPKVATREVREAEALAKKKGERERYLAGLKKTRRGFVAKLGRLIRGRPEVDDDLKDEIEELLFTADIGTSTAAALFEKVSEVLDQKQVADEAAVWEVIRAAALEILDVESEELNYDPDPKPHVLLMVGVNGVGKTTTLGKIASRHLEAGRKVLLVAGDTFRAAAAEQLEVWARRVGCDIHMGKEGSDPSSVIFDGIRKGVEEGYDIVMCDTAGRLHTKKELMDELGKIGRSATKALSKGREGEHLPHDTFLVLDATIGQNALAQAKLFKETMNFSGLVLTKLDGTAKGGVILGICDELQVPVRYIGIGEGVDDLRRFDPETFVDALLLPDVED